MIFVTVGTQLPFDRLIAAVDGWCCQGREEVIAQVGPTKRRYRNLTQKEFLSATEFDDYFDRADLVIAHAGMGSILTALTYGKPIIVMPRKASLGEHRNDHQLATARKLSKKLGVTVAWDEGELLGFLSGASHGLPEGCEKQTAYAGEEFIANLRNLING